MKKRAIGIACIILCVIIITSCSTNNVQEKYIITEQGCQALFGCSIEDFFDLKLEIYDHFGDFRKSAKINGEGNLIIYLSPIQKKVFGEFLLKNVQKGVEKTKIDISEDYRNVKVYCFEQTKEADMSNAIIILDRIHAAKLFLNNVSMFEINVEIKDGITEETVVSYKFPDKNATFPNYNDYTFSRIPNYEKDKQTQYIITPYICELIFGVSPNMFFEEYASLFDYIDALCEDSYVDDDGNLVLSLTVAQRDKLKNIRNINGMGLDTAQKSPYINISSDYSKVEIYGYAERFYRDINCVWSLLSQMILNQILEGVPSDSVNVEVIIIDGGTGEIVSDVNLPSEGVIVDITNINLSPLPENSPETEY